MTKKQRTKKQKVPEADRIAFVIAALENRKEPPFCGICLYGALVSATSTPSDNFSNTSITSSLRKQVEFWRTLYAFVFEPRTDEEIEALMQRLSRCDCPLSDGYIQHLHSVVKEAAEDDPLQERCTMVQALAPDGKKGLYTIERTSFVTKALMVLEAALVESGVRSVAKGTVQTWPMSPLDLVPHGAQRLVQTLLQWYNILADSIVFRLAACIIHVCRFMLIPAIAKYHFSERVVLSGKQIFDETEPHTQSPPQNTTYIQHLYKRANQVINSICAYFRTVYTELPVSCRMEILAGCETKAMQMFSLFIFLGTKRHMVRDAAAITLCATFCQDLYRFFHMHLYPNPDYPVPKQVLDFDRKIFPPPASVRSVVNNVVSYIDNLHKDTQCSAYGCHGSIQSAGNDFQRCSRCRVVSYCSRECQISAWRDEKYPHKKVCPTLRVLIEKGGGFDMFVPDPNKKQLIPRWPGANTHVITGNWDASGVDREMLQYVDDWMRWLCGAPNRAMPDGSVFNPGFDDYNELVERTGQPYEYLNRLLRWPSEEAQIKATFEELPFFEQKIDRFVEPMPRKY